jgi:hypothetical protein
MHAHSRKRLFLAVVALLGGMIILGQISVFAQSADPMGQGATQGLTRNFLLFGGAFQEVDIGQGLCDGRCAVPNAVTNDCTCLEGYTAIPSGRVLVDVVSGDQGTTCGSFLYVCAR